MFPNIKLGIEPNEGDKLPSMDEMRRAIDHGSRDSHLIRGALDSARYRGLSGEDTYVLLAYHALVTLEDTHKRLMRLVSLTAGIAARTGSSRERSRTYPMANELSSADPRVPKEHGVPVSEVVDLGGPVVRIVRTTYVTWRLTEVTFMTPADEHQPARSVAIGLNDKSLNRLLETLAWPK